MAVIGKMMLLSIMALCLLAQSVDCRGSLMRDGCDDHRGRHRGGNMIPPPPEVKPKDSYSTKAVDAVKSQLEEKTGNEYESLEVLKYREYLVAGSHFFIKVKARTVDGSESIMHLAILYQPWKKGYTLGGYQADKTEDDEIKRFNIYQH